MPHPRITNIKNAIANGAGYNRASECLVVGGENKNLDLVDGEWVLVDAPAGRKIQGQTGAFISIATLVNGWDASQGVPCILRNETEEAAPAPPWDDWGPFGPQDRTLVEGTVKGQPYAVLGNP